MQDRLPFALYEAFSNGPFGGAGAGIVDCADGLSPEAMQNIAREVGAPATAFLRHVEPDLIDVRFFSTMTEYGMCGHGTVALATYLTDVGKLSLPDDVEMVTLRTSGGTSPIALRCLNNRLLVMLDLKPSDFEAAAPDPVTLAAALGIQTSAFNDGLPFERAVGDFIHLMVPVRSLDVMESMAPDFGALADQSRANGVHTITVFTQEVCHDDSTVHCRDFCPVVGTPESPGAGTTNGALTAYLVRHGLISLIDGEINVVVSEQGYECGKPSHIRSEFLVAGGRIERLAVGGHARKSITGELHLSKDGS